MVAFGNSGASSRLANVVFGGTGYTSAFVAGGTSASPTAVASGTELGGVNSFAYNGTGYNGPIAAFRMYANQTQTTGAGGTYADIVTTPNGSTTEAEVIRFNNDAGITVPSTVTGGDEGAGTINAAGLYVNGVAVSTGGTPTFPLTVAGTVTSGGIPYFNSTTQESSSALLPSGDFVLGGGAGAAPTATFSVVPIANGGTGSATAAAHTIFGNTTGSSAAPAYSTAPSATSLTLLDTAANSDLTLGLTSYTAGITSSPIFTIAGSYESASTPTYAESSWTMQNVIGAGVDGTSKLTFTNSGSTGTGSLVLSSPNPTFSFAGTGNATINSASSQNLIVQPGSSGNLYLETNGTALYLVGIIFPTTAADTSLSRNAAGVWQMGTTSANSSGRLELAGVISAGTTFTSNAGCSESTLVGGATAGKFTSGTGSACTIVITMGNTATAPNGWSCWANDQTGVPTVAIRQTASTTTTASLLMTVTSSDVINFGCMGY
jgi:hypothetical protein